MTTTRPTLGPIQHTERAAEFAEQAAYWLTQGPNAAGIVQAYSAAATAHANVALAQIAVLTYELTDHDYTAVSRVPSMWRTSDARGYAEPAEEPDDELVGDQDETP